MNGYLSGGPVALPDARTSSLDELRAWFESRLSSAIPPEFAEPRALHAAMRYACDLGKRIRPLICLASAAACGGDLEEALPAAIALELIHSYSLVHDDLPALDDDDTRRGRPSVHAKHGEGLALLVGDALLTAAFGTLAAPPGRAAGLGSSVLSAAAGPEGAEWAARRLAVVRELAAGAGSLGMVGGQAMELIASRPAEGGLDSVARYVAEHKTGALFRAACRAGGLAAGASHSQLGTLTLFGATYGLAYQILDDLCDRELDERKPASLNTAFVLGEEVAIGILIQARSAACAALDSKDWTGPTRWLEEIVAFLGNES